MKNFEYKYLKINTSAGLAGKNKGGIVRIKCSKVIEKIKVIEDDKEKEERKTRFIPVERYWRDRLKDAAIDKCVEFIDKPKLAEEVEQEEGKPGGKDATTKKPRSKNRVSSL